MDGGPVYCKRKISLIETAQSIFENIAMLSGKNDNSNIIKNLKPSPKLVKLSGLKEDNLIKAILQIAILIKKYMTI